MTSTTLLKLNKPLLLLFCGKWTDLLPDKFQFQLIIGRTLEIEQKMM